MRRQGINFVDYIWSFGDYRPIEGLNRSEQQVPASTAVSSADLLRDKGLNLSD